MAVEEMEVANDKAGALLRLCEITGALIEAATFISSQEKGSSNCGVRSWQSLLAFAWSMS
jgi:hypothetical protein